MIVVADAGPIHYLILIEAIGVLFPLYDRVLIPEIVSTELKSGGAPESVRTWMEHLPNWCEIRPDPPSDPDLDEILDLGERAAIALALAIPADRLLIDDREGRVEAERRNLRITGTLGVLAEAHQRRPLDFESALSRLSQTNFYLSQELLDNMRKLLADEGQS